MVSWDNKIGICLHLRIYKFNTFMNKLSYYFLSALCFVSPVIIRIRFRTLLLLGWEFTGFDRFDFFRWIFLLRISITMVTCRLVFWNFLSFLCWRFLGCWSSFLFFVILRFFLNNNNRQFMYIQIFLNWKEMFGHLQWTGFKLIPT